MLLLLFVQKSEEIQAHFQIFRINAIVTWASIVGVQDFEPYNAGFMADVFIHNQHYYLNRHYYLKCC